MAEADSLVHLEATLKREIASFDDSRKYYRTRLFRFSLATAGLSALTTVLIAAEKIFDAKFVSVIALVSSAAITVFAAWDQFLRSREFWVQKTDTWMILRNIEERLQYAKEKFGSLTQEQIDTFYDECNQAIMEEHFAWKRVRSVQVASAAGKRVRSSR